MEQSGTRPGRRTALALTAVLALASSTARGADINGFLRQKGKGDVAVSYTHESYDEFWMGGEKVSAPGLGEVETRTLSLWFAYGLAEWLTLVAQLPYVEADSDGAGGFEENDVQDFTLMGKFRLASGGSTARSDLIGAVGFRTNATNYEPNSPVDVGDGTDDWLFRLVYHLTWRRLYVSQQVGFDLRGGEAPDGLPLYTEIGATWGPVTYTAFYSRLRAEDGSDIGDPGFTFPGNEEEYERAGGKVYGRVTEHFGLTGLYFTTLDGRNTGDSSGVSLGVNVRF